MDVIRNRLRAEHRDMVPHQVVNGGYSVMVIVDVDVDMDVSQRAAATQ